MKRNLPRPFTVPTQETGSQIDVFESLFDPFLTARV